MLSALRPVVLVLAGSAVLAAQPAVNNPALGGSVLGFVEDGYAQLRPIFGVPGASTLGPAIALDSGIQVVAIAPNQDYILGVRGDTNELVILTPAGTRPLSTGVSHAILSPRGSSAVLLTGGIPSAQVITGLPNTPAVTWKPDLSALPAPPSSIAVSDDGTSVLAASSNGDRVSIFLITAASGPRLVASAGQLGGLSFIPGTTGALFGDARAGQVQVVNDGTVVAAGVAPLDVASSDDGHEFLIASSNPSGIIAVNRATGAREIIPCDCNPNALVRLGNSGVFRLTDSKAGLFWLLDSGSSPHRIVAVPPDPAPATGGAQ